MLAFPKGKYFLVSKLKVTRKKYVSIRLVSMVIESSSSLNNAIVSFLIMSSFGPFALSIAASPSFLYKATLLLSVI